MPPRWKLVTFDIDGTLTTVHGWRVLAEAAGRLPEYDRTNRAYLDQQIGEDEHLTDLLRLADGLQIPEVERILAGTPKVGGIREAVARWHVAGSRVAILSHNPDYVCAWYVREFGFDAFAGTTVPAPGSSGLRLPEGVRANKISGLRDLLARWRFRGIEVAHVGDGWADAALFPYVGAGVALNSRLPEVERQAELAVHLSDIRELPPQVDALPPTVRPVRDPPPA